MSTNACRLAVMIALAGMLAACAPKAPPAAAGAPRFPNYPTLDVPPALKPLPRVRDGHARGWERLQAGDLRAATREFTAVLTQAPDFYPSETGLGFTLLADRQFRPASARFNSALAKDNRYLPAWIGQAEAQLGLANDAEAVIAMERVLAIDPKREAIRSRLELVRVRQVQALLETGRRARQSGRHDEARNLLERALTLSPTSTLILSELALAEVGDGALSAAETHARRAVQLEASNGETHAVLGAVLESAGKFREAAASYARALAIDPRPEWRGKVTSLRERADMAALPAEFGDLASLTSVTRAHVAAVMGIRLGSSIDTAPRRVTAVATDVRGHWAATWILPLIQAGIMDVQPNHTFQPSAIVRRGDLAQVVSRLVPLVAADRTAELTRWRAARPTFSDLAVANLFYRAAALAVASGAMAVDDADRFQPTRPATGPELSAVVARLQQLTGR